MAGGNDSGLAVRLKHPEKLLAELQKKSVEEK
jgi:hypothetical protein